MPTFLSDRFGTVAAPSNASGKASVNAIGALDEGEPLKTSESRPRKPER